jgi:transposase
MKRRRHELTDGQWALIENLLPGKVTQLVAELLANSGGEA